MNQQNEGKGHFVQLVIKSVNYGFPHFHAVHGITYTCHTSCSTIVGSLHSLQWELSAVICFITIAPIYFEICLFPRRQMGNSGRKLHKMASVSMTTGHVTQKNVWKNLYFRVHTYIADNMWVSFKKTPYFAICK